MNTLFGTDGIRGRAFEPPLDKDTVGRLGAALAGVLTESPHVLLAGDTRSSTEILAGWFAGSFAADGGAVTWGGVLPTPAVSQLVRGGDYGAGVVISASHNPAADNGIKILGPSGEKLDDSSERRLEERIVAARLQTGGQLPAADRSLAPRYLDLIVNSIGNGRPLSGMHLVVDAANGAGSGLAEELFDTLGARVTSIASSPDGSNINRGCGATAPALLAQQVAAHGADAGVALDGDADRCMLVDENGRILDGDDVLFAWSRHLADRDQLPGRKVVATVMSNFGLENALLEQKINLVRSSVGDRWVWQLMLEHGAALGGEQSGHVICSHYGVSGDGLLTASHLLSIAARRGEVVSALSNLERFPQILINVPVARKTPFEDLPSVLKGLAATEQRLEGRGRVLLRYSGTEGLARVMIEGDDADEIEALAEGLAETIRQELG